MESESYLRGAQIYFRNICVLCVDFINLYFLYEIDFWLRL